MEKQKKLRVFEAFAGIGAQASALKRMNINYEIVGISDWFIDAIECYAAIHCKDVNVDVPQDIADVDEYLSQFTFSANSVDPYNVKRLTQDQRRDLYRANKKSKNYGSITELKGVDMPSTDLLVYSFPCQDLSTGGLGKGMSKGSGTRSGLLWEIERILKELNELGRLPEYLLLENVKTIKADSNKKDLEQWLNFLESMGYKNDECMILNSLDFGVPQDRERAFIISHLGQRLNLGETISKKKKPRSFNIHKFILTNYDSDPVLRMEADMAQLNKTPSRDVMWAINGIDPITSDTTVRTITCNMDRTHTAALFKYKGEKGDTYRRLTLREAFLMMGFTEKEYLRAKGLGRNMSNIPSKNTKPEEVVRKYLFAKGFRYRKNVSKLPGKPDIVLPKYKAVIFVNGCFWHGHQGCKYFIPPKTNTEFWFNKFKYNQERDGRNYQKLREMGWRVLVIWECEIRHGDFENALINLISSIKEYYLE